MFVRIRRSISELRMIASVPSDPSAALLTSPWIGPKSLRSVLTKLDLLDVCEIERQEIERAWMLLVAGSIVAAS